MLNLYEQLQCVFEFDVGINLFKDNLFIVNRRKLQEKRISRRICFVIDHAYEVVFYEHGEFCVNSSMRNNKYLWLQREVQATKKLFEAMDLC